MIIKIVDSITNFLNLINKNQIIKTDVDIVKVNLGSGLYVAKGWINIDSSINALLSKYPKFMLVILFKINNFVLKRYYHSNLQASQEEFLNILKNNMFINHNLENGIPFENDSVDYIYSSHFLEHLFREDTEKLLMDAHRVLKKNGLIRIDVPNLEYAFDLYKSGKKEEALEMLYIEGKISNFSYHRYMYDYELLSNLLKKCGFKRIKRCEFHKGKMPDINVLEKSEIDTLFVEAIKS